MAAGHSGQFTPCGYLSTLNIVYTLYFIGLEPATFRSGDPLECRDEIWHQKTRIMGVPDGEEIMTMAFFVLTQYRRVTDRRTDGRTDRHVALAKTRASIASRGYRKKHFCQYCCLLLFVCCFWNITSSSFFKVISPDRPSSWDIDEIDFVYRAWSWSMSYSSSSCHTPMVFILA